MNGAPFHGPAAIDWDSLGNMWVANDESNSILKIGSKGGAQLFGAGFPSKGMFKRPLGLIVDSHDVVYVSNVVLNSIVRIYPNGQIENVVKGGPVSGPVGLQVDSEDNIYVACAIKNSILKIKYPAGEHASAPIELPTHLSFGFVHRPHFIVCLE